MQEEGKSAQQEGRENTVGVKRLKAGKLCKEKERGQKEGERIEAKG
jgi:hypothetical protein